MIKIERILNFFLLDIDKKINYYIQDKFKFNFEKKK